MASANDILTVARAEIGNKEYPANSNKVKYNTEYYGSAVSGSSYPWCCVFVWWVFKHAGASELFYGGIKTAGCSAALSWFKQRGQFYTNNFKPGDVVFFNFAKNKKGVPGHVGIVESVSGGTVTTIEGNTGSTSNDNGGAVMRRSRSMSFIVGVGRPSYSGSNSLAAGASGTTSTGSTGSSTEKKAREITKTSILSFTDVSGGYGNPHTMLSGVVKTDTANTLLIQHDGQIIIPNIEDGVTWEAERSGTPGKLSFKVLKDSALGALGGFTEGDAVKFTISGTDIFFGFIFKKQRASESEISVTAYDQLRYLKNKDTLSYQNKTASQLIKMLAEDYSLRCGTIEDTGTVIASRLEENKTLFDMIQNALDLTLIATKKLYVLYDDVGKLTLKNIESMKLNLLVDESSGESFDYTSSIDGETYDKVKLTYDNTETGTREVYIAQNGAHISQWGVLQYFEKADDNNGLKEKVAALLELYDQRTRNLTVKNVKGDVRVRPGCAVAVRLNLGDFVMNNYMVVQKVKHTFKANEHSMDLTLIGGEFVA